MTTLFPFCFPNLLDLFNSAFHSFPLLYYTLHFIAIPDGFCYILYPHLVVKVNKMDKYDKTNGLMAQGLKFIPKFYINRTHPNIHTTITFKLERVKADDRILSNAKYGFHKRLGFDVLGIPY